MATLKVNSFADKDAARTKYLNDIDIAAEDQRALYITPGNGQAMTYEEKHRQALAGGGAMITAEAQALECTEQEVIDSVLLARAQWDHIGSQIEAARIRAKRDIREAQTPAEMHQIVKQLSSALEVL